MGRALRIGACAGLALHVAAAGDAAASGRRTALEFPGQARVFAQVGPDRYGQHVSIPFTSYQIMVWEGFKDPLNAYLVQAGGPGCEPGTRICRDGRATASVRDPAALPPGFEIVFPDEGVADRPPEGFARTELDAAVPGLRAGAAAVIDCAAGRILCRVTIRYAPDLAVRFYPNQRQGAVGDQMAAVDGFMRDVIRDAKPAARSGMLDGRGAESATARAD